ncbi:MAG: hypothetical protein OXU20_23085 [Myxococcales bacterium]|nr:hypothetical protein [Myxococcales bacterium]
MKTLLAMVVFVAAVGTTKQVLAQSPIDVVIAVAKAGYQIYSSYADNDLTLEEARNHILSEIDFSRDAVLDHIDNLAAVGPRTCARTAIGDFGDLDVYGDFAVLIAGEIYECVALTHYTAAAVQDQRIADELGVVLHLLAPIALLANEQTGLSTDYVVDEVLAGEATLYDALTPHCRRWTVREPGSRLHENFARCVAYNGDSATSVGIGTAPPLAPLIRRALRNTSAAIRSQLQETTRQDAEAARIPWSPRIGEAASKSRMVLSSP